MRLESVQRTERGVFEDLNRALARRQEEEVTAMIPRDLVDLGMAGFGGEYGTER